MKKSVRSTFSMVVVLAIVLSLFAVPAQAAVRDPDETNDVIYTYYISRADCQEIYNEMPEGISWSSIVKEAILGLVSGSVIAVSTAAVEAIVNANYISARNAFYKGGYVSGYSGCKMFVYDNAPPTIIAY